MTALITLAILATLLPTIAASAAFTPAPTTPYATEFIAKSENRQWFLDEVERLLNIEQKTINTITSAADLGNIRAIGLNDADITGQIPTAIGELGSLEYLFLGGNHFSGSIPSALFSLAKLKNIDLSGSNYAGAVPSGFGTMVSLETLILEGNNYTGNIPSSILSNTKIKVLNLKSNQLTGGVPSGISGMTALEYLNLSDNNLGGTMPSVAALTNLKALSLWRCGLVGTIHDSVYALTDLQILDLALNAFSGEISPSIANLTSLQFLSLASNKLRGTIPNAFNSATLEEIHLENNFLRGTVPVSLKTRYDGGATVFLQNNYLTGAILRDMPNNEKNFTDSAASEQYQLIATKDPMQIYTDKTVNIYSLLRNKSRVSGNTTQKILLNPDEYVIEYDPALFEVTIDANGIHIKALADIPEGDDATITIYIKDNAGSAYSTVQIHVTTDSQNPPSDPAEPDDPAEPTETVTHKPYITGYTDGTFKPENNITREEVAAMVIRALEIETRSGGVSGYSDVSATRWSSPYIEAAGARGYVTGYPDGTFKPANPMTRAELATLLVRVARQLGNPELNPALTFSDVKSGAWYYNDVLTAARLGLVTGYANGTFRPDNTVTRAEAVTMINRMLGRDPTTALALRTARNPFEAGLTTHWAYLQILEASITHEH
jgi:Leucine-rich repeat (LRR) protein